VLAFAALTGASSAQPIAEGAALDPARIDPLFSAFTDQTPGCAASIVRDGRTIYARGFGLADLSHRAPIRPDTVFEIASVTKQFTALAVLLLEADGKLRLDDSVQQHLPEVARLITQPVSLRQLLHHTGGLVGYQELMELAGVAYEDVVRPADVLRTIAILPALHSPPGTRFAYSDTGYVLLAQVVARLGGGSLDAFLQQRVFGPLGMTSTYVYNDHRRVVPHRARAYEPNGQQGWRLSESNWVMDGDAGVHSTALDMARWAAEVTRPRVLPPPVIESLRTPGRLNDGSPMTYGMGQYVRPYRGLPSAMHSGGWVGYRSMLMHFPTQDASVVVLCNVANAPAGQLAQRMVDEVLAHVLAPVPAVAAAGEATLDVAATARYDGQFLHEGGFEIVRIAASGPGALRVTIQLDVGPSTGIFRPSPAGGWLSASGMVHLQFDDASQTVRVSSDGRPTETYRRVAAFTPSAADLAAVGGRFRQGPLGSELVVARTGNSLTAQFNPPVGDVQPLQWVGPDHLAHSSYLLRIERDTQGMATALIYNRERVRGLRYERQQ
jgi:CubicO group peptidase (beta-lactamase class C family)